MTGVGYAGLAVVARYTPAGQLDQGFSTTSPTPGAITFDVGNIGTSTLWISAGPLVMRNDSIMVGGATDAERGPGMLVHLTSTGDLDPAFSGVGFVASPPSDGRVVIRHLTEDRDGRVIVVGFHSSSGSDLQHGYLVRYGRTGAEDQEFRVAASATVHGLGWLNRALVSPDGHILVFGETLADQVFGRGAGRLVMFGAGGSQDENFGWPSSHAGLAPGPGDPAGVTSMPDGTFYAWGFYSVTKFVAAAPIDLGQGFNPVLFPQRLLDTRNGIGAPKCRLRPGEVVRLQVAGNAGIPGSGVTAAVLNVTVVDPQQAGFVTAFPCGTAPPEVSNVNFVSGQTVANLATVRTDADGAVCFTSSVASHLLADPVGWFAQTGGGLEIVQHRRILDTRTGIGGVRGRRPTGSCSR